VTLKPGLEVTEGDAVYFVPPLKGFSLELGIGAGSKILEWWGYRSKKEVWRYLQPSGYNIPTWQTDVHRETSMTALITLSEHRTVKI